MSVCESERVAAGGGKGSSGLWAASWQKKRVGCFSSRFAGKSRDGLRAIGDGPWAIGAPEMMNGERDGAAIYLGQTCVCVRTRRAWVGKGVV